MNAARRAATVALVIALVGSACGQATAPTSAAIPAGDALSGPLRFALAQHVGADAWTPVIEDVTIRAGLAQVTTTVPPDHPGQVDGLCGLLADVLYDGGHIRDVGGFVIRAVDGSTLIRRDAAGQSC